MTTRCGVVYSELSCFLKYIRNLKLDNFDFSYFSFLFNSLKNSITHLNGVWLVNSNEVISFRTICDQRLHPHLFDANRLLTRIFVPDLLEDLKVIYDHLLSIHNFLVKYPADRILTSFTKNMSVFSVNNDWEAMFSNVDLLNNHVFGCVWSGDRRYVNVNYLVESSHNIQRLNVCDLFKLSEDSLKTRVFSLFL